MQIIEGSKLYSVRILHPKAALQRKTVCLLMACFKMYRGADKSLARPRRKQAAPVKSVMGRGMD